MTPRNWLFFDNGAYEFVTSSEISCRWVSSADSIRPVINLASNVEITGGVGTQNNPYMIRTNTN